MQNSSLVKEQTMSSFLLRVELLHKPFAPTSDDYTKLHARMASVGFHQAITSSNGQRLALPPAEYFGIGQVDLATARKEAIRAASSGLRAGLDFRLVIAEISAWQAHNLAAAA
jgi:hypothetical protein